jgi:CheY-like chemotaxis protein
MKRILFFDDDPERHEVIAKAERGTESIVTHAHSVMGAIHCLQVKPNFDVVCLDHDMELSDEPEATGMEVAEFIAWHMDLVKIPRKVVVHSFNTFKAFKMHELLHQNNINSCCFEFYSPGFAKEVFGELAV